MATAMYYSCGDSTADLKTSGTIEVVGTTATFSAAQTGNIGVGDVITYNTTDKAYIVGKTSTTVWTVRSVTGGTPPAAAGGTTLDSIKHTFPDLATALGASGYTSASYLNGTNLVSLDVQVNIACYRDSADDTSSPVHVALADEDGTRYCRIFTPTNTGTECNASQRHTGKWGTTGYRLTNASLKAVQLPVAFGRVEGLQLGSTSSTSNATVLQCGSGGSGNFYVEQCVISMAGIGTGAADVSGIHFNTGSHTARISNCAVFADNHDAGNTWRGILIEMAGGTAYIYNCSVYNAGGKGIWRDAGTVTVTNCLCTDNATDFFGTITQSYNASSDATASGTGSRTSQTFTFVDAANGDLHLTSSDAGAKDYGTVLSGDANYPIGVDIDNVTRSGSWDIGADEYVAASSTIPVFMNIYRQQRG